jgi:hypothetical protein
MRAQGSLDSFGTILSGLAKRLGLQSHLFELRLQQQWREIVGEPIGSHTWPAQIRYKKLYLTVRNSVWLQQLTFLKPTLLAKLNERAGTDLVTDIAFRVGEIPSGFGLPDQSVEPAAPPPAAPVLSADDAARIDTIQDLVTRRRFTEVIGTYLSRAQPPRGGNPSRVP